MPMPKIEPTKRVCPVCGAEFWVGGRGRPHSRQRFCSRRCGAYARVKSHTTRQLTVAEAAYLAGLIDGEGTIIAIRRSTQGRHTWRLSVSNTNFDLLNWCVSVTGVGSIIVREFENHYKRSGSWQCYSWNAYDVLKQCEPYMIIKKAKAKELMAELDSIRRLGE